MRLAVTTEQFFEDEYQTNFLNRMMAFLDISYDKIKIVGMTEQARRDRFL